MHSDEPELAFCRAAVAGEGDAARALLAAHPELAETSVHVAAARADAAGLEALLGREPGLRAATLPGAGACWTPLLVLCSSRIAEPRVRLAAARVLVKHMADAAHAFIGSEVDADLWQTPLGAAASLDDPALCTLLVAAGAEPADGVALFRAVEHDAWKALDALLAAGGELNDVANRRRAAPLHHVLDFAWSRERLDELLRRGADPNARTGPEGESALHVAVRRRRLEPIAALLAAGAELDARTLNGMTTWRHAVRRGFGEVAAELAERGADTTPLPADELAVALLAGDLERARVLLDADPRLARDPVPEEARLLPDLAGRNAREAVVLLLERGWPIDARGLDGGTALHNAAWFCAPETAELLVAHGAPLDLVCRVHDASPLGWCAHGSSFSGGSDSKGADYARIAELLLDAGARLAWDGDPAHDPGGRSLLRCASEPVAAVLRRRGAG